ncbi:MAG: AmmeMemoRadiSam system protein A [Planctomycetota bacterium]|nr:AmmeMemoRadiSam system protein A [Planctomycetota bacterium]
MPSEPTLGPSERDTLRRVAAASIAHGLRFGSPMTILLLEYPSALHVTRATFTTLDLDGRLRGCIGSLEATRPLVDDVAHSAFGAAFRDPRFAPVTQAELPRLQIHISILAPATPMTFASEEDLLGQLRPGVDGLILSEESPTVGRRRGTFLPAVWETLPDPRAFLQHLKRKAGLPEEYWSNTLKVSRYTAESV